LSEDQPKVDDPLFERSKLLLEESNILFDRYMANIDQINSKILALFQIFLVIVTLQLTIIGFIISTGSPALSWIHFILLLANFFIIIITFTYYYGLIWPKSYQHVEIFEEKRFNELCSADKNAIVQDFLYYTRESHLANESNYKILSSGLKWTFTLLAIYLLFFMSFLISLFLGKS
jgi:ABC-type multidrug transport system fused ATPase/permease subunit